MHFRPWVLVLLIAATLPLAAHADSVSAPPSREQSMAENVHVQPRRNTFMPNSAAVDEVQRRIADFNQKQEFIDTEFDKRLRICHGC